MDLLLYGAAKSYIGNSRESFLARALIGTLQEGQRSVVLNFIGDSTGNEATEYPALFATKLAEKFPVYNVKYCDYDYNNSHYRAWSNLVSNGAERYVATVVGKLPPYATKLEVPITSGDIDVTFRVALDTWATASDRILLGRYGDAGARCWFVTTTTGNRLALYWSVNGTDLVGAVFNTMSIAANTDGAAYWYRITLDVDNGAGGYDAKCYSSEDGVTWTLLQTVTGGAPTSVFDHEDQPIAYGGYYGNSTIAAKWYEIRIRDGINGDSVSPQPIEAWHQAPVADAVRTGVPGGAPTIYVYNACVAGLSTTNAGEAALLGHIIPRAYNPIICISLGHNDAYREGATYVALFKAVIDGVRAITPQALLCVLTQNPHTTTGGYVIPHSKRRVNQMLYCNLNNIEVVDGFGAFVNDSRGVAALLNVDGLHPNADGEAVLTNALWDYVNIRGK